MRITIIAIPHHLGASPKKQTSIEVLPLPSEFANSITLANVDSFDIKIARHALVTVLQDNAEMFSQHLDSVSTYWDYNRLDLEHVNDYYSNHITMLSSNPDMYTANDNMFTFLIMRAI